ncbi:hypothetical protein SLS62_003896 [Diatrype stigma]|uniref:SRP54-type proteins GTP-binding domain-containing protein n=1 Tax=Diatrype stigma TaxID=117547 RepID=A0AAN9US29_9PEZI
MEENAQSTGGGGGGGGIIVDDKSPICIPFILERLREHTAASETAEGKGKGKKKPFIIGLNGVQGVGKTTLVSALAEQLRRNEGLETLVCSIDDFYLTHTDQKALAAAHPDNQLVQVRGEPARRFFAALCAGEPTRVPRYDKSRFAGEGDRVLPEDAWETVNDASRGQRPVQVVIFEGWCVGFRSLSAAEVEEKWRAPSRTLKRHALEHLQLVNSRLAAYDSAVTDHFDAFIHVDAADTEWVYDWRREQEVALRREKGSGMTDEQVVRFVDAYYPAYELFSDRLRRGLFPADQPGRQLRLVVGKDRRVQETVVI